MRKSLCLSVLIGLVCILAAAPQAQAQRPPTCEAANNTSCPSLGATQPCWSVFGQQTLTCWCFSSWGNLIWSCPIPDPDGVSAATGSCDAPAALFASVGSPAPYCGDLCENEGEGRGCREVRPGGTFRTPCTCVNGRWYCGP